jgi:uncharacterized protein YdeI (YjbR/CyaY-like superfamily)
MPQNANSFGWMKVKGYIDDFELMETHLMPIGKGHLFLPVKAEIRKKIRKQAGDKVKIQLFMEEEIIVEPSDFMDCLNDEPQALAFYNSLKEEEKKSYSDYIDSGKTAEKRIERIIESINNLAAGIKKPLQL